MSTYSPFRLAGYEGWPMWTRWKDDGRRPTRFGNLVRDVSARIGLEVCWRSGRHVWDARDLRIPIPVEGRAEVWCYRCRRARCSVALTRGYDQGRIIVITDQQLDGEWEWVR
jgi:hypothetical protein